jgi:hypothetical protein
MRRTASFVLLCFLAGVPALASAGLFGSREPWAELDASTAQAADTVPLTVLAVDHKSLSVPKSKLTLVPGPHGFTVASSKASASGTVAVTYKLEAAACTRYRVAGRPDATDATRLEIVVVAQEPIAGCHAPEGMAAQVDGAAQLNGTGR